MARLNLSSPISITPSQSVGRSRLWVALALLAVYVIWGSTYLAIRVSIIDFPPFTMAGMRFLSAGSLLYFFLRARGAPTPDLRQWGGAALVGGFLLVIGNGGVVFAEQWVDSGLTALVIASVPIWAALFGGLWGVWPARMEWAGLAVGFAGVLLLNLEGGLRANPVGAAALLLAAASWAFGSVWSRRLPLPPGMMASAAEMLTAGVMLSLIGMVRGERMESMPTMWPLLAFLYLVVFGALVGFSAYSYLLRHVRPGLATSYAYVNPIVAVALGVGLLGEQMTLAGLLAMPVILSGVALVMLGREQKEHKGSA